MTMDNSLANIRKRWEPSNGNVVYHQYFTRNDRALTIYEFDGEYTCLRFFTLNTWRVSVDVPTATADEAFKWLQAYVPNL